MDLMIKVDYSIKMGIFIGGGKTKQSMVFTGERNVSLVWKDKIFFNQLRHATDVIDPLIESFCFRIIE